MLISFSVSNFQSIKDKVTLDFTAVDSYEERADSLLHPIDGVRLGKEGESYLSVMALFGANGSGKSTLIEAIQTMKEVVFFSGVPHAIPIRLPHRPFALDGTCLGKPTTFSIDFIIDNTRYEYSFSFTATEIVQERLVLHGPESDETLIDRRGQEIIWSPLLISAKVNEDLVSNDMLAISYLAFLKNRDEARYVSPIMSWILGSLEVVNPKMLQAGGIQRTMLQLDSNNNSRRKEWIKQLLTEADLGIESIGLRKRPFTQEELRRAQEVSLDQARQLTSFFNSDEVHVQSTPPDAELTLLLRHNGDDGSFADIPYQLESDGTKRMAELADYLAAALDTGGTLVVDELDAPLHPIMVHQILDLFLDKNINRKGAQLLFSTQDTELMDSGYLRRDAIWFTQKGRNGATELTPLSEYDVQWQDPLATMYLAGQFDAIPVVNDHFDLGLLSSSSSKEEVA